MVLPGARMFVTFLPHRHGVPSEQNSWKTCALDGPLCAFSVAQAGG